MDIHASDFGEGAKDARNSTGQLVTVKVPIRAARCVSVHGFIDSPIKLPKLTA